MDPPTKGSAEPKRARLAPAADDDIISTLPDNAIHRIFDYLTHYADEKLGDYNVHRRRLSRTSRRFDRYFRHHYATSFTRPVNFSKADYFLKRFSRLNHFNCLYLKGSPEPFLEPVKELYHRITRISMNVLYQDSDLCALAQACPLLKILSIYKGFYPSKGGRGVMAVSVSPFQGRFVLGSDFSLPSLEELSIVENIAELETLAETLYGLKNLRKLTACNVPEFYFLDVFRALPQSLECLELARDDCFGSRGQLTILGKLPRLKDLTLTFGDTSSLLKLLPMVAGLEKLSLTLEHGYEDSLGTLILGMRNLRSMELTLDRCGSWDGLLQAISTLECLENLELGCGISNEPLEKGLLYLANGPARRSLVNVVIKARVDRLDAQKQESLARWLKENFEPMFEKGHGRVWDLAFNRVWGNIHWSVVLSRQNLEP